MIMWACCCCMHGTASGEASLALGSPPEGEGLQTQTVAG
jgi:hypothetical protein